MDISGNKINAVIMDALVLGMFQATARVCAAPCRAVIDATPLAAVRFGEAPWAGVVEQDGKYADVVYTGGCEKHPPTMVGQAERDL